jgi:hypothetical protein
MREDKVRRVGVFGEFVEDYNLNPSLPFSCYRRRGRGMR